MQENTFLFASCVVRQGWFLCKYYDYFSQSHLIVTDKTIPNGNSIKIQQALFMYVRILSFLSCNICHNFFSQYPFHTCPLFYTYWFKLWVLTKPISCLCWILVSFCNLCCMLNDFLCYYGCLSTLWLVFKKINWHFLTRQSKFPNTYYQIQTIVGKKLAQLICTKVITHCSMLTINSRRLSSCILFDIFVSIMIFFWLAM